MLRSISAATIVHEVHSCRPPLSAYNNVYPCKITRTRQPQEVAAPVQRLLCRKGQ